MASFSKLAISFLSYFMVLLLVVKLASSEVVTLTPSNPTSDTVSLGLVDEGSSYNEIINGEYHCKLDGDANKLCAYLKIKDDCNGISTIKIDIYGSIISGDVDLFSVFSYTDAFTGMDRFFSVLNNWHKYVTVGNNSPGGVYVAPHCTTERNEFFSVNNIFELLDNRIDNIDFEEHKDLIRMDPAGGDYNNYELLSVPNEKVNVDASPISITLVNNRYEDETIITFNADGLSGPVSCTMGESFGAGSDIIANFFSDHANSEVAFSKFDVDYTCDNKCDYTHTCHTWGDPHTDTFDGTKFHFQGEGYFNYVKLCKNSDSYLPFSVVGKHEYCGSKGTRTCVKQVIVGLLDHKNYYFHSNRNPTIWKPYGEEVNTFGEYSYIDSNNGDLVKYTINKYGIEIEFMYENNISRIKISYRGTTLNIDTTDCLSGDKLLCGLCGNINEDPTDDFQRCDDLQQIDVTNSDISFNNEVAWANTHDFGESCCNAFYDNKFIGITDCGKNPPIPPKPTEECMNKAKDICNEFYDLFCKKDCDEVVTDEWLNSCAMDFCAEDVCQAAVIKSGGIGLKQGVTMGCLDTTASECMVIRNNDILDAIE
jgi:hypothetical protein